jgi:hypothetical protein
MGLEQLINYQKNDLKKLERFRAHVPVMKVNARLSDEKTNELQERVNYAISCCEFRIKEYEQKLQECF